MWEIRHFSYLQYQKQLWLIFFSKLIKTLFEKNWYDNSLLCKNLHNKLFLIPKLKNILEKLSFYIIRFYTIKNSISAKNDTNFFTEIYIYVYTYLTFREMQQKY